MDFVNNIIELIKGWPIYVQVIMVCLLISMAVFWKAVKEKSTGSLKKALDFLFKQDKDPAAKSKFTREDVLMILFDNTQKIVENALSNIHDVYKRRLADQMVLADQLLTTYMVTLNTSFEEQLTNAIKALRVDGHIIDAARESEQRHIYNGIVKLTLHSIIRNELRRIFKNNGFHSMTGDEWESYKFSKFQNIIAMFLNKLTSEYPSTMFISYHDTKIYFLENHKREMFSAFSVMMNSVKLKYLETLAAIEEIKKSTKEEVQKNKDQLGL